MTDTELLDVIESLLHRSVHEICVTSSVSIQAKCAAKYIVVRFNAGPWCPTLREAIEAFCERRTQLRNDGR